MLQANGEGDWRESAEVQEQGVDRISLASARVVKVHS